MSRTDRIERARIRLIALMIARDRITADKPVALNRLQAIDAAIDAEMVGAVLAQEDLWGLKPPPPPEQDDAGQDQAADGPQSADISELRRRARLEDLLRTGVMLAAILAAAALAHGLWPRSVAEDRTMDPVPVDDDVPAEGRVVPAAPSIAPANGHFGPN